ncbi:MAG: MMPL family transporter [Planctomycetia bacterium]|nr:MMPL family transporter [Planctomycetia bacterium]
MNPEPNQAHETAFVPRLLVSLVKQVCRRPVAVLTVALLLAAASVYAACRHLEYHTQRTDLVSPHKDYQQRWKQYLTEFGDDDDMVVVVEGGDRERMKQALDTLAARVQDHPELFDRLFYRVDLRCLRNRALLYFPAESIKPIQGNLKSMGLLLEFGPWSWRTLGLVSMLREARHRAGQINPDRPLTAADEQFLGQLLSIGRSATATLANPDDYRNPWGSLLGDQPQGQDLLAEPQYFFSPDGGLAFLLVRPVKEEGSFTSCNASVTRMRAIIAELKPDFANIEFGLTGLPVLEDDEMTAADRDTRLASWLAIAGVTLLFFVVYRGICYPLLTMGTLLVGTAWALGWTTLTLGHLNILSAAFAVMLIGMGDYGVLWVMCYEQARREGRGVQAALLHTTSHVGLGNLTAAATLALAFFTAMLADFRAVAELGWIVGCGVLFCALACFTVLPAALMLLDRRKTVASRQWSVVSGTLATARITVRQDVTHAPDRSGPRVAVLGRRSGSGWIIAAGVLVALGLGVCATQVRYDHNLLNMQPRNLESVAWELKLIEHTAGASWHALSCTASPEEALALKARFEQLPEVSRVVEVASLVPRDQPHKIEMLRDIQQRLKHLPPRGVPIPHARPNSRQVQTELACLIGQLQPLAETGNHELLADLRHQLIALQTGLRLLPLTNVAEERLQRFDERLAGDLAEDLHRLKDVSTPAAITTADLPPALRERYLGQTGKWLLRVFARDCLWDFQPLEHFTRQIQTVDPEATGKPFGTVEGLKGMKDGFQWAGVYALVAITVVLLLDFRKIKLTLLALLPLALGVVMTLGVLGLFGIPLNPANTIAFPLILGVGVDNGVHVLHDWRLRRKSGRYGISPAIFKGVLTNALTTMIGFGTLMISTQRGLVSLGFILTVGVGCCMVAALVFLPAVLRLLSRQPIHRAPTNPEALPLETAA